MKILVAAPHPDDEVLGCGGTIARLASEGHEIHLCIVTAAYEPEWSKHFVADRPRQVKASCEVLGIKSHWLLGFPTVKLDTVPQKKLNAEISKVFQAVKPDIFFIPHGGDCMKDHRLIYEACLVAARPHIHRCEQILAYETLSETEWGLPSQPFLPNVYYDVTNFTDKKIAAFKVYESEVIAIPHPRNPDTIRALARKRGSEANMFHAEAFMLVRAAY